MNHEKNHPTVRFLFLDVDGTLTDGRIYMGSGGEALKAFNIKDGLGIHDILPQKGIEPVIITGRKSKILELRASELGIVKLFQDVSDKKRVMAEFMIENNISPDEGAYIGDDINDIECLKLVKFKGCPSDSANEVIGICDFVSSFGGGMGAVREFIEWL